MGCHLAEYDSDCARHKCDKQQATKKTHQHITEWIMKIIARKIKEWGICSNENTEAYIMKRIGVISSWDLDLKEK